MKELISIFFVTLIVSVFFVTITLFIWNLKGPKHFNYKGKNISFGTGSILIIPVIIGFFLIDRKTIIFNYFLIGIIFLAITGLIDDIWGNKNIKGLKGHISQLIKGNITTGMLKAFVGIIISFIYALNFSISVYELLVNFIVLLLFINTLNLFDLRPGRCCKVFFVLIGFILVFAVINKRYQEAIYMAVVLAVVLPYFFYDIKSKTMLGDAGSNLLGFIVGFSTLITIPLYLKTLLAVGLVLLHWYTEKISLTEVIENSNILKFLDNLGRI